MYLHEGQQGDLLEDELFLGDEVGLAGPTALEPVEAGDVARVHDEEQFDEPLFVLALERLEDGVGQQLAQVVDALAEQGGHAEREGPAAALVGRQRFQVGAAEEAQRGAVKVGVPAGDAVKVAAQQVEATVHRRHAVRLGQDLLHLSKQTQSISFVPFSFPLSFWWRILVPELFAPHFLLVEVGFSNRNGNKPGNY